MAEVQVLRMKELRSSLNGVVRDLARFPLILTLDMHGVPHRWITWQHACYYYAKERVAWSLGATAFTIYGGIWRFSGVECGLHHCH